MSLSALSVIAIHQLSKECVVENNDVLGDESALQTDRSMPENSMAPLAPVARAIHRMNVMSPLVAHSATSNRRSGMS